MNRTWTFYPINGIKSLLPQFTVLPLQGYSKFSLRLSSARNQSYHSEGCLLARPFRCLHSIAKSSLPMEDTYHPEADVEDLEDYAPGGYHPTLIGDTFCSGRYTIVHKLGYGG